MRDIYIYYASLVYLSALIPVVNAGYIAYLHMLLCFSAPGASSSQTDVPSNQSASSLAPPSHDVSTASILCLGVV